MTDKVFAAETAVKNRMINIAALASAAGNEDCAVFYSNKSGRTTIDLSFIKDDQVARTVVYALYDYMRRQVKPSSSVSLIGQGFLRFFNEEPALFESEYPEFVSTLEQMNRTDPKMQVATTKNMLFMRCMKDKYANDPYACDYWVLGEIPMSPDRVNPTSRHRTMNFSIINDATNKRLCKQYIKHLLLETNEAVSTVLVKQHRLRAALNIAEKPFTEWTSTDVEVVISHMQAIHKAKQQLGPDIVILEHFAQYMVEHDVIKENIILPYHNLSLGCPYEFHETNRDMYIISQIFSVLGKVTPSWAALWFLLLFTTGMRKSEATALKRNCLEVGEKDQYYIRFYNQKMKKDVVNRIPEGLFRMVVARIADLPKECMYIFPSRYSFMRPMQASSVCAILNREFERLGVRNTNGTPFRFKAHDLRHWMATRMDEEKIPVQFIQEQLHHTSPEMTMAYVEFLNKAKAKKMKQYIDANGDKFPAVLPNRQINDKEYAAYVQKNMSLRVLPNGLCARPKALGHCARANSCLTCSEFRTELKDLPKHRAHLKRLDDFIAAAERYGWEEQARENKEIRENLLRIIKALENELGENNA